MWEILLRKDHDFLRAQLKHFRICGGSLQKEKAHVNGKKISTMHTSDTGCIARTRKEHAQLNEKKTNKMAKGLGQTLPKEYVEIAKRHMKSA